MVSQNLSNPKNNVTFQCQFSGAFVIPFMIMLVLEGMPLLLLELGIGQKMRKGSFVVWNLIHPSLGGIGLGSTVIAIVVGCYYNVIIAWCIYYLGNSFFVNNLIAPFVPSTFHERRHICFPGHPALVILPNYPCLRQLV